MQVQVLCRAQCRCCISVQGQVPEPELQQARGALPRGTLPIDRQGEKGIYQKISGRIEFDLLESLISPKLLNRLSPGVYPASVWTFFRISCLKHSFHGEKQPAALHSHFRGPVNLDFLKPAINSNNTPDQIHGI